MDVNPGGGSFNPPPVQPQGQYPHNRPSWFSRNWLWFIPMLLFIIASPFACCIGFGFFGYQAVMAPRDGVVEYVNSDARITEKLGTPITAGSRMTFSDIQNNNGNGSATMDFDLVGPDGTADIEGDIKGVGGTWTPNGMTVTFSDGSTIQVPE